MKLAVNRVRYIPRSESGDKDTARAIMAMLTQEGDPTGLQVRCAGDRWLLTHQTCILVARRR